MILEIITPEATLFNGEVDVVTVPGVNGQFQMLNNHAPIVSLLIEGEVKFKGENTTVSDVNKSSFTQNKEEYILPIKSGTVEMKDNKIIVLVD
ncbi:MAG TPA: F0F1 ATP synthase subunit epsilon [Flavobacteriaceae bacterium]|nr:F0F1 ATP synthase subunit epsilon [Flavobacteriaceae bacterium]